MLSHTHTHRYALEGWASNDLALPYTPACTDEQKEEIANAIGDISAVRSEAFGLTTKYADESQGTVDRLAAYAALRAAYDANYLDNRTQAMQDSFEEWVEGISLPSVNFNVSFDTIFPDVDNLMSCVSVRSHVNASCPYGAWSAYQLIEASRAGLEYSRDLASARVDEFAEKAEVARKNADDAYQNAKSFYDGVKNAVTKYSIDTSDWGAWYNIDIIDIYPWPVIYPDTFSGFPHVMTTDEIWAEVSANLDNFYVNLTAASLATAQLGEEWKQEVQDQIDKIPSPLPEDYNPPQYVGAPDQPHVTNVTAERKAHEEKSKGFIDQAAVALDAFSELSQYEEDEFEPPKITFNYSDFANRASEFEWNFESLRGPGFDINLWFISFGNITSMLFALDFAFRAYQSIRLAYYYWTRGAVGIPDVDLSADQEPSNPFRLSTPRLFALIASHPMTPAFITLFFVIWGGALMSSIYEPLYEDYIHGCVQGGENGTFLTENVFSLAYNYASQDGNSATLAGIDSHDMRRSEICSQYGSNSANSMNGDTGELATLKAAHAKSMESMMLYSTCIDYSTLDVDVSGACCGLSGFAACDAAKGEPSGYSCPINELVTPNVPFEVPGVYIAEPNCQTAMVGEEWMLEDAVFNCDALPTCDLSCGGPHRPKMEKVSETCGCMVEWGMHSVWIQVLLSVIIYVLVNMSRIGLVTGCCKLFWSAIHPGLFTFKGTATRDGELVVGRQFREKEEAVLSEGGKRLEDGTGKGEADGGAKIKTFGILIKEGLDKILPKYRLKGLPQVIMALAINIPWIYALKTMGYNIAYKPS
jgi:hypothetical protein